MKRLLLIALFSSMSWADGAIADWQATLAGISAGEKVWLDKVPELAAKVNVKQSIELEYALAQALSTNTVAALDTLSIMDSKPWPQNIIGTDMVCGVPVEQSPATTDAFYHRTRMALLSTDKGALCLWVLEATYEEWKAEISRKGK
ncbi:hypothetical protein [Dryocola sp. BD626]|uniref:hypothetical protein n=1 Tax=Dryocola sp. BD626 TaxID=3133273 RepID=UPI003F509C3D